MKSEKVSELTTNRLSVYLRCLNLLLAAGIESISSRALADQFNLNSAQIRKDLAYFGEFGVRGVGYCVKDLHAHLTKILGLDVGHRIGIIGAGRLGTALANYGGFSQSNFDIVALFDSDRTKVGSTVANGVTVYDMRRLATVIREQAIDIIVLTVPARVAQRALNQAMAAGVRAALNFAPVRLHARLGVKVKNVDLAVSLESLSCFLATPQITCLTSRRNVLPFEELAQRVERDHQDQTQATLLD